MSWHNRRVVGAGRITGKAGGSHPEYITMCLQSNLRARKCVNILVHIYTEIGNEWRSKCAHNYILNAILELVLWFPGLNSKITVMSLAED